MRLERVAILAPDFAAEREAMVERQLRRRGITEKHILDAFLAVPREAFVAEEYAHSAYGDHPLPIEAGQTISQPYIVAVMIQGAGVQTGHKVLEVGAGSGYAAAVISRIAARVVGVERQHDLVAIARERMALLGYENVEIVEADGTLGWQGEAPYDAILVAAGGSHVPQPLIDQLAPNGAIVMPIGSQGGVQTLLRVRKAVDGSIQQSDLGAVRFVPLIGEEGWSDDRS